MWEIYESWKIYSALHVRTLWSLNINDFNMQTPQVPKLGDCLFVDFVLHFTYKQNNNTYLSAPAIFFLVATSACFAQCSSATLLSHDLFTFTSRLFRNKN